MKQIAWDNWYIIATVALIGLCFVASLWPVYTIIALMTLDIVLNLCYK